jgi:hypothetical protein
MSRLRSQRALSTSKACLVRCPIAQFEGMWIKGFYVSAENLPLFLKPKAAPGSQLVNAMGYIRFEGRAFRSPQRIAQENSDCPRDFSHGELDPRDTGHIIIPETVSRRED